MIPSSILGRTPFDFLSKILLRPELRAKGKLPQNSDFPRTTKQNHVTENSQRKLHKSQSSHHNYT